MKGNFSPSKIALVLPLCAAISCSQVTEPDQSFTSRIKFDISVTRVSRAATKTAASSLDNQIAFGLIGVDSVDGTLVIDNKPVYADEIGSKAEYLDEFNIKKDHSIGLSAYYPYMENIEYNGYPVATYSISYTAEDVDAGPLVSKTVQTKLGEENSVPLPFKHITNDIGFAVYDGTKLDVTKGYIHLRKIVVKNMASEGVYVDTIATGNGTWTKTGGYRDVVVFDGDAKIGVGLENEKFVGIDHLCDTKVGSARFHAVPEPLYPTCQYVEVTFDIEDFTVEGYHHGYYRGAVSKYLLYGTIPGNRFDNGAQYTFHIGLDAGAIYREVVFGPVVDPWVDMIFEDNGD